MSMKKIVLAGFLLAGPAYAAGELNHNHEGEAEFDVESYQLTLKGVQPFGEACFIGVVTQGQDASGYYFADIETSFDHEGEGPGRLTVKFDVGRPGFLAAVTETGSRITIALKENGTSLADALRYAVRWAHDDHIDSGLCEDLTIIHDAAVEQDASAL